MFNLRLRVIAAIFIISLPLLAKAEYGGDADKNRRGRDIDSMKLEYANWHNLDPQENNVQGTSVDRAYSTVLKKKTSKTVVVAIIDSGIDIDHEDLKGSIWTNKGEIPGNGIDDDHNGYVDDVHGWNFLGNADGRNIDHEALEFTRLVRKYKDKFEGKKRSEIPKDEVSEYDIYEAAQKEYTAKKEEADHMAQMLKIFDMIYQPADSIVTAFLGKKDYTIDDLKSISSGNDTLTEARDFLLDRYEKGFTRSAFESLKEYSDDRIAYNLNLDYNPRGIIGDDPDNINDSLYGNNDVKGDKPDHGTHVAGIIAANRYNNLGIKGIADNVKIMSVRTIPDGDERDKDVVNAIRYAVDNGAQIINMSFGKMFSPHKRAVDAAIHYAEKRNVLIIHAAGNDAQDIDKSNSYPTNYYSDSKIPAQNWLTIGASAKEDDAHLAADFTNYGRKRVDIFAPGVNIYSLQPNNTYELKSGTSMACPVVTGVAALLMSYFPQLSIYEIKDILLESGTVYKNQKVLLPDESQNDKPKMVKFKKLSATGEIVNAYRAVEMAESLTSSK